MKLNRMNRNSSSSPPKPRWAPFIAPNQLIWFVGYNPGIRSFETQSYYAHPTNRFWKLLYEANFIDQLLESKDFRLVCNYSLGMIDLSTRPTVSGSELSRNEFAEGKNHILKLVQELQPKWLAANGLGVGRALKNYKLRNEFGDWGLLEKSSTRLWVLPSSSGRAGSRNGVGMSYADKLQEWKRFHDYVVKKPLV